MNQAGSLKWLIWVAVLIGILVAVLDAQDRLTAVQEERAAVEKRRQRELAAVAGIDWAEEAQRAQAVQAAWLDRLPESVNPAVTRVKLMEQVGRLCDEARLQCEVAQLSDGSQEASPANRGLTGTAKQGRGSVSPSAAHGVSAYAFRVAANFTPEGMLDLLDRIEAGERLYAIQSLAVRNNRLELKLIAFALDEKEAKALRSAASLSAGEVVVR